jgi:hypothetical protein
MKEVDLNLGSTTHFNLLPNVVSGSYQPLQFMQSFENCFPIKEANPINGAAVIPVVKRQGTESLTTSATTIRDIMWWAGFNSGAGTGVFVNNTQLKRFDITGSQTVVGSVPTASLDYKLSEGVLNGTPYVFGVGDNGGTTVAFYAESGTPAVTQITDSDFITTGAHRVVGRMQVMDGWLFAIGLSGRLYNFDLNSPSSIPADGYTEAETLSDGGVTLVRHKDTIVAFGFGSIEFFRNAGRSSGSPLVRIPDSTINIGVESADWVCEAGGTIWFLGKDRSGVRGLYRLNGFSAEKVSSADADLALMDFFNESPTNSILHSATIRGCQHIGISRLGSHNTKKSLYLNTDTGCWWFWEGVNIPDKIIQMALSTSAFSRSVFMPYPEGTTLFKLKEPYAALCDDNGTAFTSNIYTGFIDLGSGKNKFLHRATLFGDVMGSAAASDATFTLGWADQWVAPTVGDYTFSTVTLSLSSDGRPFATRLGMFRRRKFRIQHTGTQHFKFYTLKLSYTEGVH